MRLELLHVNSCVPCWGTGAGVLGISFFAVEGPRQGNSVPSGSGSGGLEAARLQPILALPFDVFRKMVAPLSVS